MIARLLGVEVRRFLARRLMRLFGALLVLGIVIAGVVVFLHSHPPRPAGGALGASQRQALRDCTAGQFGIPTTDPNIQQTCRRIVYGDTEFRLVAIKDVVEGTTVPLVLMAWLLAASFVGAEWHAGTIGALLTWEPRRLRVFASKLLACILIAFSASIAFQLVLGLVLSPSALLRGTTVGANAAWFGSTAAVVLRGSALAALFAAFGYSIASVTRSTAGALGAGFGYLLLLENLLGFLRPGWRSWMLIPNSVIVVAGERVPDVAPRSVLEAVTLLTLYGLGLLLVAAEIFRRRDVA